MPDTVGKKTPNQGNRNENEKKNKGYNTSSGNEDAYNLGGDISQLLSNLPVGSIGRAINDNHYGINARTKNSPLPMSKDNQGYTFFTRPQLRLEDENISNSTVFHNMLSAEAMSYQRHARCTLDPRLAFQRGISCPMVDPYNAFMPILTNSITSLSGMPSMRLPTYTSESGGYGQMTAHTDGVPNFYEVFDMTATFRNFQGNSLIYFFTMWEKYQSNVYEGIFNPYWDFIVNREIDYNTRIYRLVTDETNRYVTGIACTGASFPTSVPVGEMFDFSSDTPLRSLKDISINFTCIGFLFNEEIIKLEFNQVQAIFNPEIAKILKHDFTSNNKDMITRENPRKVYYIDGCNLAKIPVGIVGLIREDINNNPYFNLNYNMYPYINLATNELEWWASTALVGGKP